MSRDSRVIDFPSDPSGNPGEGMRAKLQDPAVDDGGFTSSPAKLRPKPHEFDKLLGDFRKGLNDLQKALDAASVVQSYENDVTKAQPNISKFSK